MNRGRGLTNDAGDGTFGRCFKCPAVGGGRHAPTSYAGERAPATSLGLLDATMVGVGATTGAGIFVPTGLAAETAGPAAIVVFAVEADEATNLLGG